MLLLKIWVFISNLQTKTTIKFWIIIKTKQNKTWVRAKTGAVCHSAGETQKQSQPLKIFLHPETIRVGFPDGDLDPDWEGRSRAEPSVSPGCLRSSHCVSLLGSHPNGRLLTEIHLKGNIPVGILPPDGSGQTGPPGVETEENQATFWSNNSVSQQLKYRKTANFTQNVLISTVS